MKSVAFAIAAVSAQQLVEPFERARVVRSATNGEMPVRPFYGPPGTMKVGADSAVGDFAAGGPFYYPAFASPAFNTGTFTALPVQATVSMAAETYPAVALTYPAGVRQYPVVEAPIWRAPYEYASRRGQLENGIVDANIDQFANQAGGADYHNRGRVHGPTFSLRESLTPTGITSERNYAGPGAGSDQGFKAGTVSTYRNTGNTAGRASRAASAFNEPVYAVTA